MIEGTVPGRIAPLRARFTRVWSGRGALLAGVFDAGLSSLATFALGFFAVRYLEPAALGGYALCFRAFSLVAVVPSQLTFVPAEVAVVGFPRSERLGFLWKTVALGVAPALASALTVLVWVLMAPPGIPPGAVRALTITTVATAFLSPIQDHVRRMLHAAGASWQAAAVSAVHLGVVAGLLVSLGWVAIPAWWIPFGGLALANLLSLGVGLLCALPRRSSVDAEALRFKQLLRAGRWLVLVGLLAPGATFLAAVIVSRLVSAEALGYAEAARTVAHPLLVLSLGLSMVLGPASVEAAQRRSSGRARRISRAFIGVMATAGIVSLLFLGLEWPLNPVSRLLPNAYAVGGLVSLSIVAAIMNGVVFPYRSELLGGRREAALTRIEVVANVTRILLASTARVTQAYAIPLGLLAVGAVRWTAFRRALQRVYRPETPAPGWKRWA